MLKISFLNLIIENKIDYSVFNMEKLRPPNFFNKNKAFINKAI
ncbi:hypothetical protein L1275_002570 [Flavobacterium sp. HSC-61S13]|nr:hypothetical protein [Flavobacterium sp. HSC-61S13]